MPNVYFVLYGEFEYRNQGAMFGERCGLGWTIGEEIYHEGPEPVKRLESVVATTDACLLQMKLADLETMQSSKAV